MRKVVLDGEPRHPAFTAEMPAGPLVFWVIEAAGGYRNRLLLFETNDDQLRAAIAAESPLGNVGGSVKFRFTARKPQCLGPKPCPRTDDVAESLLTGPAMAIINLDWWLARLVSDRLE